MIDYDCKLYRQGGSDSRGHPLNSCLQCGRTKEAHLSTTKHKEAVREHSLSVLIKDNEVILYSNYLKQNIGIFSAKEARKLAKLLNQAVRILK